MKSQASSQRRREMRRGDNALAKLNFFGNESNEIECLDY